MTIINARLDGVIRPSLVGGEQAYTLILTDTDLRALHTGKGWDVERTKPISVLNPLKSLLERVKGNPRAKKADKAGARITEETLDRFSQDRGSLIIPLTEIKAIDAPKGNELRITPKRGSSVTFVAEDRDPAGLASFGHALKVAANV